MKKIFLVLFMFIIGISSGYAANITEDKIGNVYANQTYKGEELSASFGYMYADGGVAYCIDPGIPLKIGEYNQTYDFRYKGINTKNKEKLELIAYYGYQYPGHSTEKYYYATQALIWETIGSTNVSFTTERNRNGKEIVITKEKKEIQELINKFLLLPSFAGAKIHAFIGETITFEDSNNNFFNFNYSSNNQNTYNFDNDKFNIKINEAGEGKVNIFNEINNNKSSIIYYSEGYQSLVTLGINLRREANITIIANDPNRIMLKINNYDNNDGIPLSNSSFKIKNIDTNEYIRYGNEDIFYTNEEGFLIFPDYINSGKYQIEQVGVNDNYFISDNCVIFVVDENTATVKENGKNYLVIDYFNERITDKNSEINTITKLPKTSNNYFYKYIFSILLFIIGMRFYYEKKNNKTL